MKKRLMNNLALKIAALIFAAVLWFLVVSEIDPVQTKTFPNVVVSMVHDELITNKGNTYRIVTGNTISVEVTANRTVLEKISERPGAIKAIADIKEIQLSSFVPINVKIVGFEGKYKSAVAKPNNVEIKIETSKSKRFPINVETVGTQQDGLVIGELIARPESVEISGPMSLIGRIEKAVARVDINGISKDTTLGADLILYDGGGNIIDQTSLENNIGGDKKIQVRIKMLSTKSVNLKVDPLGLDLERGYQLGEITCEPQKIKIAGESADLAEITELVIPASILNLGTISHKTEATVDLTEILPERICLANENEKNAVVTIWVERAGTKSFEVPVSAITKSHVLPEHKVDFGDVQVITLQLTGDDEALEKLTLDQVIMRTFIDLKDCTEEKAYRIPVKVDFPEGVTFAEEVYVTVTLQKVADEQIEEQTEE